MKSLGMTICAATLLCACASSRPDHFYILSPQPPAASTARTSDPLPVTLKVTLPSLVDRAQMILNTSSDGITILEHERWAAPLTDLVTQALARDLEHRRGDVLVDPSFNHTNAAVKISVNVVQMTVRSGDRASIETQWRIVDSRTGTEAMGSELFSAPLGRDGYAQIASSMSECLGLLADRLASQIH